MAAVGGIVSRNGPTIEVHHKCQPNKTKLVLHKAITLTMSHSKQLYKSNKMDHLSYKGGCVYASRHLKEELVWTICTCT